MVLEQAAHKATLYQEMLPVDFPIEKLADASSAAKKLVDGAERTDTSVKFADGEQKFTQGEWTVLRDVVANKKSASVGTGAVWLELRELFEITA